MVEISQAEQIMGRLKEISTFTISSNPNLEHETIKSALVPYTNQIEAATTIAGALTKLSWDGLPASFQTEALSAVNALNNQIAQLREFKFPANIPPQNHADKFIAKFFQVTKETNNKTPLSFHTSQLPDFASIIPHDDPLAFDALPRCGAAATGVFPWQQRNFARLAERIETLDSSRLLNADKR